VSGIALVRPVRLKIVLFFINPRMRYDLAHLTFMFATLGPGTEPDPDDGKAVESYIITLNKYT